MGFGNIKYKKKIINMEFPLKVLVIALLALIAFVVLLALINVLSGGSFNLLEGVFAWFEKAMP